MRNKLPKTVAGKNLKTSALYVLSSLSDRFYGLNKLRSANMVLTIMLLLIMAVREQVTAQTFFEKNQC
ncbi:MAG TPA: hypothetical protein ENN08_01325 [Bacteroidales bacterium]|nr:hypothetical protein [Bacteroidales bacterium]